MPATDKTHENVSCLLFLTLKLVHTEPPANPQLPFGFLAAMAPASVSAPGKL